MFENMDGFSKFFHQLIRKKIFYFLCTTNISTSPAIYCYTTLWNLKIQKKLRNFHVERDN